MTTLGGGVLMSAVLAAVLLPMAIWLLLVARRRRLGVQSYCTRCDYPLQGLPPGTARCPECGADPGHDHASWCMYEREVDQGNAW